MAFFFFFILFPFFTLFHSFFRGERYGYSFYRLPYSERLDSMTLTRARNYNAPLKLGKT